jgi:carbamate kinase
VLTVVALGGNALVRRSERADARTQQQNVKRAAAAIAQLVSGADPSQTFVLTHGNGPQVGLLALQNEAEHSVPPYPLDLLDAESEGMIGYLLERELRNCLPRIEVATLLTQVVVESDDPAFDVPSKPIGRSYLHTDAERLTAVHGWHFVEEGAGQRRVVPSPEPREILGLGVIRWLLEGRCLVICAGGGGIPVVRDRRGSLTGVEAVIDKDRVSAQLAGELGAERLMLLTDVDAVYENFGRADAQPYPQLSLAALRRLRFAPGSMGPKVEAARRFAERGGEAIIGRMEDAAALGSGRGGTRIRPD